MVVAEIAAADNAVAVFAAVFAAVAHIVVAVVVSAAPAAVSLAVFALPPATELQELFRRYRDCIPDKSLTPAFPPRMSYKMPYLYTPFQFCK